MGLHDVILFRTPRGGFALRLRELPEVREDVMTEVTKRLLKGVHLTRVAAEQAADAIVDY